MAETAGPDEQLDLGGGLDDQMGCGFAFAVFLGVAALFGWASVKVIFS